MPASGPPEDREALIQDIRSAWESCRLAVASGNKERLRRLHLDAKQLDQTVDYAQLLRYLERHRSYFPNAAKIDPERIDPVVLPVHPRTLEERLFKVLRGYWSMPYSKGYGRRLRFLVLDRHHEAVIGIIGLQSPSADLACRDAYLGVHKRDKLRVVNNTLDAYTIGAAPTYAPLLAGKLVAGLLHSPVIRREYWRVYAGNHSEMSGQRITQPLLAITTASAFGRSSIYNRLRFNDRELARPLGYTKGFGTLHLESLYPRMARWLSDTGRYVPAGFGNGPKVRWQNITRTLLDLGMGNQYLQHGVKREVFIFELVENLIEACRSCQLPAPTLFDDDEWAAYWRHRWCAPRSVRNPDWHEFDARSAIRQALAEGLSSTLAVGAKS